VTVIDNAVYANGRRIVTPASLHETFEALEATGGFAWIGLYRPDEKELGAVSEEFGLHELAVEDTLVGHQRAKLDRYSDTRFIVLRPARYIDRDERVEFGEVHLFVGAHFVVAIRHAEAPNLALVRARLEHEPELLERGPLAVLYAILDRVVDDYEPVVAGLENDIDEIEEQLFTGDAEVARRIYDLSGEVMEFQRAVKPLVQMIEGVRAELSDSDQDEESLELRRSFRDVLDHVLRITEKAEEYRQTLQNALAVNATLVAQRQNEEMKRMTEASLAQGEQTKKISSWAAILFAPSLIAGIYGMNFHNIPELALSFGYPLALLAMVAFSVTLYFVFKSRSWL